MGATTVRHRRAAGEHRRPGGGRRRQPGRLPAQLQRRRPGRRCASTTSPTLRTPRPYATWMNFGEHPESLDGYNLISADYLAPLQRFVDRDTGSTLVFTQGAVGSQEGPYEPFGKAGPPVLPDGTVQAFAHAGYAQAERGARLLADAVLRPGGPSAPARGRCRSRPTRRCGCSAPSCRGPVSHPYPSWATAAPQPTADGDPGVPARGCPTASAPAPASTSPLYENLRRRGADRCPTDYARQCVQRGRGEHPAQAAGGPAR